MISLTAVFRAGGRLAATASLLVATASAAPLTLTWGAQGEGGALASSTGLELPAGCLVRLGYFNQSLSRIQEVAWDTVALDQHFTELARAKTGEFDGAQFELTGTFAQTVPSDSAHLPAQLANQTVCVWACNAPTLSAATEIGIFTSRAWQMSVGQVGGLIWDLNQVEADGLLVGSISPTMSPTLGGQMNQLASLAELPDMIDIDRDGVPAILEEAFGMNPAVQDVGLMPQPVVLEAGVPSMTGYRFRRPAGGTAVTAAIYETAEFRYIVEVSDDLRNWHVDPAACQVYSTQSVSGGYEIVTLQPEPNWSDRPDFYRLRVERMN